MPRLPQVIEFHRFHTFFVQLLFASTVAPFDELHFSSFVQEFRVALLVSPRYKKFESPFLYLYLPDHKVFLLGRLQANFLSVLDAVDPLDDVPLLLLYLGLDLLLPPGLTRLRLLSL